jgi:tRNA nucleotidyltransferase (CCA-adding enzyme)
VAAERVGDEVSKLLVAPHAPRALRMLRATGLLGVVFPGLAGLPRDTVTHAFAVAGGAPAALATRLAALLHPLPSEAAAAAAQALRLPRRVSDEVAALLRAHACLAFADAPLPAEPAEVRRWLAQVGPQRAPEVLALAAAEAGALRPPRAGPAADEVKKLQARVQLELDAAVPLSVQELALDGRAVVDALGSGPGPHVGEALRHLLDRVLTRPDENVPEKLQAELRRWWAARSGRL